MTMDEIKRKYIGAAGGVVVMEIEKGAIKRFCDSVGDPNPLYLDEEYARSTKYGSIIAPPGFFGWPAKPGPMMDSLMRQCMDAISEAGYPAVLDGGIDFEFCLPVRPGDVLVMIPKIADIVERTARTGKLVLVITERTYTNQNGAVVAKARSTSIRREIPR